MRRLPSFARGGVGGEQVIPSKDKQMGRLLKSHRKPTNDEEENDGTLVDDKQYSRQTDREETGRERRKEGDTEM